MARFEKGRAKTGGRVKGSPVTNSLLLKDAALLACQLEGDIDLLGIDLKDKRQRKLLRERYKKLTEEAAERGGLVGYFRCKAMANSCICREACLRVRHHRSGQG
jgi:hypothetical protein